MKVNLHAHKSELRCAWCHEQGGPLLTCAECGSMSHTECFYEQTRCPTLGCRGAIVARQSKAPGQDASWGFGTVVGAFIALAGAAGFVILAPWWIIFGVFALVIRALLPRAPRL